MEKTGSLRNTMKKNLIYKENFSLDEITSKLLSIRQINKDQVSSFWILQLKIFANPII